LGMTLSYLLYSVKRPGRTAFVKLANNAYRNSIKNWDFCVFKNNAIRFLTVLESCLPNSFLKSLKTRKIHVSYELSNSQKEYEVSVRIG
jgi:hypothetical protein